MLNNSYNKNSLEAVTQGSKVGGNPAGISFYPIKTTLFLIFFLFNISFADDLICEVKLLVDKFNEESPIQISVTEFSKGYEGVEDSELRAEKERYDREAVALNKKEVQNGAYWIDGGWVHKYAPQPAHNILELKDSDDDGYDDYTEYTNGSNQYDKNSIPIIRNGNNKKIFTK
jgi:hypothetical protein